MNASFEEWVRQLRSQGFSDEEIKKKALEEFVEKHPELFHNVKDSEQLLSRSRSGEDMMAEFEERDALDEKTDGWLHKQIPELKNTIEEMSVGQRRWMSKKKAKELLIRGRNVWEIVNEHGNPQNQYIRMNVADLWFVIVHLEEFIFGESPFRYEWLNSKWANYK